MKKLLTAVLAAALLVSALFACAQAAADLSLDVGKTLQTSKQANLRKQPSTKSMMLDQLDKGTRLTLLSTVQDGNEVWARVRVQKNAKITLVSATSIVEGGAHDVLLKDSTVR